MTGKIFDIQRFSIHDGPGIRTTVFLKGCPLRCIWCGNPESISPDPLLSYLPEKCIACGACMKVCPENAITADAAGKAAIDRARCTGCGRCPKVCDPKALEMVGREATVEEVLQVVVRDRAYYKESGGGMTLSGGEPLLQPDFAEGLLHAAKVEGLHCCVETSGYAAWSELERVQPLVDLWLFDYKETDPNLHFKFTGRWNEQILENLKKLHDSGSKILLRCPMIPQHNARRGHLEGIAALAHKLPKLEGVELLPYYDLWRAKLPRMGLTSELPTTVKPPSRETLEGWNGFLRERGVRVVG
ncbi:MAG: glycyl-radical enzyme activating protein [Planctomycetota bacterium]